MEKGFVEKEVKGSREKALGFSRLQDLVKESILKFQKIFASQVTVYPRRSPLESNSNVVCTAVHQ